MDRYAAEAEERWGHTDAYRQSMERTTAYTEADWAALSAEADEIAAGFAALMDAGTVATDTASTELAERHRSHISKWFYDCPHDMHRALGEMYVSDPRFTESIDERRCGLALFMAAAFAANAAGHEGD